MPLKGREHGKHRCTNMENLQAQNILTCSHPKMKNMVKLCLCSEFITGAPPGVSPEEYLHNQAVKLNYQPISLFGHESHLHA